MKVLVFSGPLVWNADFYAKIQRDIKCDVSMGICLGDMYINSHETSHSFYETAVDTKLSNIFKEEMVVNKSEFMFPIFHVLGKKDDIRAFEDPEIKSIKGLRPITQEVLPFYRPSGGIKVGFLGGYFSHKHFADKNIWREKQIRCQKANILCREDFVIFESHSELEYLFCYDSPYDFPLPKRGCRRISRIIDQKNIKRCFYGHHKFISFTKPIEDCRIIGLPALYSGFAILDTYTNEVQIYCRWDLNRGGSIYLEYEEFEKNLERQRRSSG